MFKLLNSIFFLFLLGLLIACIPSHEKSHASSGLSETQGITEPPKPLTEKELQQLLYEMECSQPSEYLSGTISSTPIYKNILSLKVQGLKLDFSIQSDAKLATFKDIKIRVRLLSRTKAVVVEREIIIYGYIGSGASLAYRAEIEISNQEFKEYESIKWSILEAKCN